MLSCQISCLCDWIAHPNVFHLCLLVFFYHMYTKCVFLPFCARSSHFTWVFQHFPPKNLPLFDLISGFALQAWLWSCTSTWFLPSRFTDFGLNQKTMIYSDTHPVPVCPRLRVLSLIENTLKQEERTFGAIIKVNLNDNSPLKCVRHLSSPVKKVF